jgi:lipopolysaccharide/colanic/teichoic acid biosynthesis glycosyltransferase
MGGGYPPPNHLVWAILSTVLCCLPLGVASIVYSTQVNSKFAMGDLAGAQEASRKAKQFAIWSAAAIGIIVIVYIVFIIIIAIAGSASS